MEKEITCLLCNLKSVSVKSWYLGDGGYKIFCPRCGEYVPSEKLVIALESSEKKRKEMGFILSGLTREMYESNCYLVSRI